jgi:putative ABC transport system substrate-binding protein
MREPGSAYFAMEQPPARVPRIGYVGAGASCLTCPVVGAFRQGLREQGYVEGEDILVEYRLANLQPERYPVLIDELVDLHVDLIVSADSMATPLAKRATPTIPIVMSVAGDPVGEGLVDSIERPGGNLTGLTNLASALVQERLELLQAAVPGISRVAVIWNDAHHGVQLTWREAQQAAKALGLALQSLPVRGPEDFEPAFAAARAECAEGLLILTDRLTTFHRKRLVQLALESGLPGVYG